MTWRNNAACRDEPKHLFYPTSNGPLDFLEGKAVCAQCPVQKPCLDTGIDDPYGLWGGLDPYERERLRNHKYPTRIRQRVHLIRPCEQCCAPTLMVRSNQRWCDHCRPTMTRRKERETE